MQELYELIHQEVAREARLAAGRWNHMMDADDIEQELWLFIMESPAVQGYLRNANGAQIKSALSQKADAICSKERLDYDHFTGNFNYNPSEVRDLLDSYDSEYDVHVADEHVDLELGLQDLESEYPDYFEVIQNYYIFGALDDDHAARLRRNRAEERLTTIMNRKRSQRETDRHEGLGTKPKNTNTREEDY